MRARLPAHNARADLLCSLHLRQPGGRWQAVVVQEAHDACPCAQRSAVAHVACSRGTSVPRQACQTGLQQGMHQLRAQVLRDAANSPCLPVPAGRSHLDSQD